MSGLKFSAQAPSIPPVPLALHKDSYREFFKFLTASPDPFFDKIDSHGYTSADRINALTNFAGTKGSKLFVLDANSNEVEILNTNAQISATKDKMNGVVRKINISLPGSNPTDVTYLKQYVNAIVDEKNTQGIDKACELLLSIMLLTRCM